MYKSQLVCGQHSESAQLLCPLNFNSHGALTRAFTYDGVEQRPQPAWTCGFDYDGLSDIHLIRIRLQCHVILFLFIFRLFDAASKTLYFFSQTDCFFLLFVCLFFTSGGKDIAFFFFFGGSSVRINKSGEAEIRFSSLIPTTIVFILSLLVSVFSAGWWTLTAWLQGFAHIQPQEH